MKPGPTSALPTSHHNAISMRLRPIVLPSPPVKLSKGNSLKMRSRKRSSPKHTPTPLPSISTLFNHNPMASTSSSHSCSSNSSYGSYCQFSPEGTYTMYTLPISNDSFTNYNSSFHQQYPPVAAATSVDEHKPVTQPLFIQTSDFGYNSQPAVSAYPTSSTINANELLLRPVPNHYC